MKISNPISTHGQLGGVGTSDHHVLYTDAEALASVEAAAEITIQGQITFPATQSSSAGLNVLDDYEEQIQFSPSVADDNLDGTGEGQTYSLQIGRAQKVGNMMHFQLHLVSTSLGTLDLNQTMRIMGLPATSVNVANMEVACCVGDAEKLDITAGHAPGARILPNTAHIEVRLFDGTGGASSMLLSEWTADGEITIFGSYEVAT